jgi:hypothetical protein
MDREISITTITRVSLAQVRKAADNAAMTCAVASFSPRFARQVPSKVPLAVISFATTPVRDNRISPLRGCLTLETAGGSHGMRALHGRGASASVLVVPRFVSMPRDRHAQDCRRSRLG